MKIRLLKKSEINSAARIIGRNYSKNYERMAKRDLREMFRKGPERPRYLIAEEKGNILGFTGYIQSPMDYHLYEIFWVNVIPEKQHKGIGTMLLHKTIQNIKKIKGKNTKAAAIILTTRIPGFYRRLGFKNLLQFRKTRYLMLSRM